MTWTGGLVLGALDPVSRSSTKLSKNGFQASRGTATTRIVPSGKASASSCSKIPATRRDR